MEIDTSTIRPAGVGDPHQRRQRDAALLFCLRHPDRWEPAVVLGLASSVDQMRRLAGLLTAHRARCAATPRDPAGCSHCGRASAQGCTPCGRAVAG